MHRNTVAPIPACSHETEKEMLKSFLVFTTQGSCWGSSWLPLLCIFLPDSPNKKEAAWFCKFVHAHLLPGDHDLPMVLPILSQKSITAPNSQ